MPQNKGKGGKNWRRGKHGDVGEEGRRPILVKEDGQEYAHVQRMVGGGRLEAYCFDGVTRLCHIRGKMRKKVWVAVGDIILVGLRDYQDAKADVIHRYAPDETRRLKADGELPDSAVTTSEIPGLATKDNDNVPFDFETFDSL